MDIGKPPQRLAHASEHVEQKEEENIGKFCRLVNVSTGHVLKRAMNNMRGRIPLDLDCVEILRPQLESEEYSWFDMFSTDIISCR